MKKLWLKMLVVFCLGVATVPGVLGGVRWWRISGGSDLKFIQFRDADTPAKSNVVVAANEPDAFDEFSPITATSSRRQPDVNPFADEAIDDFNSPAAARAAKPIQPDFDSNVEPPVLAQNTPSRTQFKPPSTNLDLEFDAGPVPVKQRTDSTNSKAEPPDGIESLAEAELSDEQKAKLTTLREKLAELTKTKAELVNEQTLEETIFSLEKQISNLHAAQKLLSAQKILRALAEEFPDSPAAAKAQRMLEAAESKKSLKPSPDPLSALPTYR